MPENNNLLINPDTLQALINSLKTDNISKEEVLKLMEEEMKRNEILSKYEIKQMKGKDTRYFVRFEGEVIKKPTRKAVEDELIRRYESKKMTLEEIFEDYIAFRKTIRPASTWGKDIRYWNRFIKNSPLIQKDISELNTDDAVNWFKHCLQIKPDMKEHYFNDLKSATNDFLNYVIEREKILIKNPAYKNPLSSFKPHKEKFTKKIKKKDCDQVFSEEEKKDIKTLAFKNATKNSDVMPLSIVIILNLGLRSGELCGLKWKDILYDETYINIERSLVEDCNENGKKIGYKLVDHCKTKSSERILQMNSECQKAFLLIKEINEKNGIPTNEDDFIFMRTKQKKHPKNADQRAIEHQFKTHCQSLNMKELKSAHDGRRTCFTDLYYAGMPMKEIQNFAGHRKVSQTEAYIKQKPTNNNTEYLEAIIG